MQNWINEIDNYIESNGGKEPPIQEEPVDTVKIPENFHHLEGESREEGIVVADGAGNEYVWIPVTKDEEGNPTDPYKDTNGELNGKVVQLQRSSFMGSNDLETQFTEDTAENHNSEYKNAIAYDIDGFKQSVIKNGGYFLARYEAGIEGGNLVIQAGKDVYNKVKQPKASELCRNIDNAYNGVTSDLVNSYAWDTAIVYIQTFGKSSGYSMQSGESKNSDGPFKTGEAILKAPEGVDVQCNIYDMAGNCQEWTTETNRDNNFPCVNRAGYYSSNSYTSSRDSNSIIDNYPNISFRPLLYWNN